MKKSPGVTTRCQESVRDAGPGPAPAGHRGCAAPQSCWSRRQRLPVGGERCPAPHNLQRGTPGPPPRRPWGWVFPRFGAGAVSRPAAPTLTAAPPGSSPSHRTQGLPALAFAELAFGVWVGCRHLEMLTSAIPRPTCPPTVTASNPTATRTPIRRIWRCVRVCTYTQRPTCTHTDKTQICAGTYTYLHGHADNTRIYAQAHTYT